MNCFQLVLISKDIHLIKYRILEHSAPCYSFIHFILFYSFTACQIDNMSLVNSVHRVHRNQGKSGKIWESLNLKTWKIRKNIENSGFQLVDTLPMFGSNFGHISLHGILV